MHLNRTIGIGTLAPAAVALSLALSAGPVAQTQTPAAPQKAEKDWLAEMRPYEARREQRQRVDDIFAALELAPGAHVADIGAGQGFFTVRLAKAVGPTGKVFAVEVNPRDLGRLRERMPREGLTNVEVIEGTPRDTHLLRHSLDAALIVNAYHEMAEYPTLLQQIRQALKPDAPLVIVEPLDTLKREAARADQVKAHVIGADLVVRELREAGFGIAALQDPFIRRGAIDEEWLIVARPLTDLTQRAPAGDTTSLADRFSPTIRLYMDEFKALYDKSDVLVIDVRDAASYREGHIPGALLVPEEKIEEHAEALRGERRLIVAYCSCPAEETSGSAVQKLARHGITNARALVGGYRLWAAEKNPIATGDAPCDGPLCPTKAKSKPTTDSSANNPRP